MCPERTLINCLSFVCRLCSLLRYFGHAPNYFEHFRGRNRSRGRRRRRSRSCSQEFPLLNRHATRLECALSLSLCVWHVASRRSALDDSQVEFTMETHQMRNTPAHIVKMLPRVAQGKRLPQGMGQGNLYLELKQPPGTCGTALRSSDHMRADLLLLLLLLHHHLRLIASLTSNSNTNLPTTNPLPIHCSIRCCSHTTPHSEHRIFNFPNMREF